VHTVPSTAYQSTSQPGMPCLEGDPSLPGYRCVRVDSRDFFTRLLCRSKQLSVWMLLSTEVAVTMHDVHAHGRRVIHAEAAVPSTSDAAAKVSVNTQVVRVALPPHTLANL
jgi:hypothetical protein